jgi:hypothetical protein
MSQNILARGTSLKVSRLKAAHKFTSNRKTSTQRWTENLLEGNKHRHAPQKQVNAKQNTNTRKSKHKTSNVFLVYTVRRTNEAFFDKERVHNFSFGSVEISSGKHTIVRRGSCKRELNVSLRPFRPPVRSTSTPRFLAAVPL